jgi:DNA repair protein RadC
MCASKTNATGIASWPQDERPRERLLSKGAQALTDAELVAILIRVGFKGTNAVEMARQLLAHFGSLRAMVEAPIIALLEIKGLKGAKAAQLIAALEIARRVSVPLERRQLVMKSTAAAAEYMRMRLRGLADEQFRVLYLNRRNAILEDALMAQGSVDSVRPSLRNSCPRPRPAVSRTVCGIQLPIAGVPGAESDPGSP